ncbi:MAG: hypothetical protein IKI62_03705 [Clostridia bacterium]|nr:hypothetical protein [Clostridia bacterium]
MTKKKKIFPAILGIFICLILLFVAVCSFYIAIHKVEKGELPFIFGKGISSSNGVYDTVEDNALVLSNPIAPEEFEPGKVVVYYDPTEKSDYRLFLGNILQVKEDGNVIIYPGSGRDTITVTPDLIRGEADYSVDDVGAYIKLLEGKYGVLITGAASIILLVLIIILFGTVIGNAKVNRQIRRQQKEMEDYSEDEEYDDPKPGRKLKKTEPAEEEEEQEQETREEELDNSSNAFDFGFEDEPATEEDTFEPADEPEVPETAAEIPETDTEDENVRVLSEMLDEDREDITENEITSEPAEAEEVQDDMTETVKEDETSDSTGDAFGTAEEDVTEAEEADEAQESREIPAVTIPEEDAPEQPAGEETYETEEASEQVSAVEEGPVVLTAKSPVKEMVESDEVPTELTVSYLRGSFKSDRVSFEISCDERSAETMKELIDQAAKTKGRFGLFTSVSNDEDETVLKIWCQWEDIPFVSDIVNQIKG